MTTIEESSCPACGTMCSLSISLDSGFRIGSMQVQTQFDARLQAAAFSAPRMLCGACGLDVLGTYHDDGQHVNFPRVPPAVPWMSTNAEVRNT